MTRKTILIIRLSVALAFVAWGLLWAAIEVHAGDSAKALSSAVLWGMFGVLVAPNAETVEDELRKHLKK